MQYFDDDEALAGPQNFDHLGYTSAPSVPSGGAGMAGSSSLATPPTAAAASVMQVHIPTAAAAGGAAASSKSAWSDIPVDDEDEPATTQQRRAISQQLQQQLAVSHAGAKPPLPQSAAAAGAPRAAAAAAARDDAGEEEDDDDVDEWEPYNPEELPAHACKYCGYHDPLAVARCAQCNKWFCNSRGCTSGSHIVSHLVRAKHRAISLHADSPLGDSVLECYVCGSKNIFMLGFIPSKEESVVVLLCREPCLTSPTLATMDWDPSSWLPLIEDRQILNWLVTVPAKKDTKRCAKINTSEIQKLEELWKTKPDGNLDDLHQSAVGQDLPSVAFTFRDGYDYLDQLSPLIDAEEAYGKQIKETVSYENVSIEWEAGLNDKRIARFTIPPDSMQLSLGDELRLISREHGWDGVGFLIQITPNANAADTLHVEMRSAQGVPTGAPAKGYTIKCVWNGSNFQRQRTALNTLATVEASLSGYLYHKILGHNPEDKPLKVDVPDDLNAPNLAPLNPSQHVAVSHVLASPLSLIQGPPGTGKTVTSATLIFHMRQCFHSQVLVCAPSNIAVDQLAERIALTKLNVVRIAARNRENVESRTEIHRLLLHVQVEQFCRESPKHSELNKLWTLRQKIGDLSNQDMRRYKKLVKQVEDDLIYAADVVCCTCSGAGDARLSEYRFKHVLIDEATQASEPEVLIPIVMGAKQVIFVGDHCQMGPTILHAPAEKAGLGRSMFERLIMLGVRPIRLEIQYRMHPCLADFSSNTFYEGTLQNGVSAEERDSSDKFPWPNPRKPMFFYNSVGAEEMGNTGTSLLNRQEAALAEKFVTHLIRNKVQPNRIGVITPYEAQRCYLLNYIERNGPLNKELYKYVEVASVDSFQGREIDFVILTCVRSSDHQGIGFLSSWRRLNVALTRARFGTIVIGNARVLARHPLWHALLTHYKSHKLIVDGPVADLKAVDLALPKPRALPRPEGIAAMLPMYQSTLPGGPSVDYAAFMPPPPTAGVPGHLPPFALPAMPTQPKGMTSYEPGLPPARHFDHVFGGFAMDAGTLPAGHHAHGGNPHGGPASQASMSGSYSQSQDSTTGF